MDDVLGFKVLLSYEIKQDMLQDYYQFVTGRYIPAMQSLGFQMSEAWHTAYGNAPNRLIGFVCKDRLTIDDLLVSDIWFDINEKLESYVTDFNYKVIPYRGGFQI
ncbi:MAG: hypothetical protein R3E31_10875 [Chloroflexota bacterium]|nr:hypothetical protein [Anaerolineales bacterium]MCA9976950.1 hypothetical protein [Anaerolineales bacterium]MCB8967413.1 hypothetical protein [Ardenticatenaceae bacterium]